MKVIYLDKLSKIKDEITLAIGNFDGVHLGHQKLLEIVKSYQDTKHAVLTFDPHPRKFFLGDKHKTLFTIKGKISLFEDKGFDYLFIGTFNKEFASLSVDEFVAVLKQLNVKRLVVGKDFRFGFKASGNINDLMKHFEVVVPDTLKSKEAERISTTLIKKYIEEGNIKKANEILGYDYHVLGVVEHGNKVGRKLGFPTANINYEDVLLPKTGVYFVEILIHNEKYFGIANIGYNPTLNESDEKKLEVYILDYNNNSYNEEVKIKFIKRLRDEIKFSSSEELINEMENDEKRVRNIIANM